MNYNDLFRKGIYVISGAANPGAPPPIIFKKIIIFPMRTVQPQPWWTLLRYCNMAPPYIVRVAAPGFFYYKIKWLFYQQCITFY